MVPLNCQERPGRHSRIIFEIIRWRRVRYFQLTDWPNFYRFLSGPLLLHSADAICTLRAPPRPLVHRSAISIRLAPLFCTCCAALLHPPCCVQQEQQKNYGIFLFPCFELSSSSSGVLFKRKFRGDGWIIQKGSNLDLTLDLTFFLFAFFQWLPSLESNSTFCLFLLLT